MLKRIHARISAKPFLRNFSLLTIGNFGSRFIAMVTNIIVARFLAPHAYGEYSLVITYISLFYFIASLGLGQLVTRSVAREQGNAGYYFKLSMILRVFGFVISAVAFLVYGAVAGRDMGLAATFAVLGGVFLESLWDGQQNVAFGMQRMECNTVVNIAASLLNLLIYICLPARLFTVNIVLGIYIAVYILKNVVYLVWLYREDLLKEDSSNEPIDAPACASYFRECLPFYLMTLLGILTGQLPVIFLEQQSGLEEVAFFNTANKLLLPITLFMSTAFTAFFPNQSILFAKDRNAFSRQTCKVLTVVCMIGVFMSVLVTLFSSELVLFLYGKEYASTGAVLAYQCWYTVLYGIFCLNGNTLGAADAQKRLAVCSVIYAVVSTPILYYSARFGADGLAVGFVISSIINLLYILPVLKITVRGEMTWRFCVRVSALVLIPMLLSLASVRFIPGLAWKIAVSLLMTAVVFIKRREIISYTR